MSWNLYTKEGELLKPKVFSNGKSQEDIVNEVLRGIEKGKKVIFIHGVCGTGKSAIALNIAKELGKASVVVPGKNLQQQYKEDYENNKYLLKSNNEKLKISVMTGRNNHVCKFLQDKETMKFIPTEKKEVNAKLNDIFEFKKEEIEEKRRKDLSAENWKIPCKIEIKEKNWFKIKEYLKQNNKIDPKNFQEVKDVKRVSIASVCPYWSPVIPDEYDLEKVFGQEVEKRSYTGLTGTKYIFYQRKKGCPFYQQFNSYIDSDVIVFNSLKYKLESNLGRKPKTKVEIIDECDEFLDSFANRRSLDVGWLQNSLNHVFVSNENAEKVSNDLNMLIKDLRRDKKIEAAIYSKQILPLKETQIYEMIKTILSNPEFMEDVDDESYLFEFEDIARSFDEFLNETYVILSKKEKGVVANLVTTNLAKKFQQLADKNEVLVLMSGTIHSPVVLREIFGLKEFEIIDAEVEQQGQIEVLRTGLEKDCKYSNFSKGNITREHYLKALDKSIEISKKPTLVQVNSFADLPNESEIERLGLKNLVDRKELREMQKEDKTGKLIDEFKAGKEKILFSTRASRGIDFPGEICNSIVFTKYPNPDVQDAFWKILKQTHPQHYWSFYKDKARREIWQRIYRGLRFKEDHIYLLSPDERVLKEFETYNK